MANPLVSVIMPVFNEELYVRAAIESILEQTYENLELIIVDDYSTDRSLEICASFKDPRIRLLSKTGELRNMAASRNIAIHMARGEYVINQDADDLADPQRIERQLSKAVANPGRRVVFCSVIRVEDGIEMFVGPAENHAEICETFTRTSNRPSVVAGTILAPRSILLEIPYRVRFKYMHDWDLLLRLFESGRVEFYNCPQSLYKYHIRRKGVIFKPDWFDYNVYVRQSQQRRNKGLEEYATLEEFRAHLNRHAMERAKWKLRESKLRLKHRIWRVHAWARLRAWPTRIRFRSTPDSRHCSG